MLGSASGSRNDPGDVHGGVIEAMDDSYEWTLNVGGHCAARDVAASNLSTNSRH